MTIYRNNEPNYLDIKKIVNFTIMKLSVDISKAYEEKLLDGYLEKYKCNSIKELIYLFICEIKPTDLNISLNMREKIKNISNEVNEEESEEVFLSSKVEKLLVVQEELMAKVDEYESLKELVSTQTQKIQELTQLSSKLLSKIKSQDSAKNNFGL